MNRKIFTQASPYKKRARYLAIIWTLLIFIACLTPAKDIPEVPVPLIDKWTHLVLFGGFAFLWLCTNPTRNPVFLGFVFMLSICTGSLIELLQGFFTSLGRSCELLDVVADALGGAIGVAVFYVFATKAAKQG